MIGMILTLFKGLSLQSWANIGLGIVIVALGVYIGFIKVQLDYQKSKNNTLQENIKTLDVIIERKNFELSECLNVIDVQNTKVTEMIARGDELQQKMNLLTAEQKKTKKQLSDALNQIANRPIPKDCVGATNELNRFMKQFATEWNNR